jgi:peptidoglycan/xylan/chitin deacetylase (PgdA/CDA1 family)
VTSLRARARRLVYRHVGGTAIVLIYHRVAVLERDPQLLAVAPEHFDAQMRHLRQYHDVLTLAELVDCLDHGRLPHRCVAVTFDDGYADNLLGATPILERHSIPATVFVSSGYCESGSEFWWDEVERVVLGPGTLPKTLAITVGAATFERRLDGGLMRTAEDAAADAGWNLLLPDTDPRHGLYRDLCEFIRPLTPADHVEALAQLREATSAHVETRESHRPLTLDEVACLDASPMVAVGGHTVHHSVLSALTKAEQHEEIWEDKATLERVCKRPLREFSYPHGSLGDYTAETMGIAGDSGYHFACASHPGVVKPWIDRWSMPRSLVRDWDAETFSANLRGWFDDPR